MKCSIHRNVLCPLPTQIQCSSSGFSHYCSLATAMRCICRLLCSLQVPSPEAADCVCEGVCPAGSRGCHAPVIHMVIVRGSARAQPRISSPVPLSGARCQPGEGRRGEKKGEGRGTLFVCLLACFVLFRGFC